MAKQMPVYHEYVNGNRSVTANFMSEVDREVNETIEFRRTLQEISRPAIQEGFKDIFNARQKPHHPPQ